MKELYGPFLERYCILLITVFADAMPLPMLYLNGVSITSDTFIVASVALIFFLVHMIGVCFEKKCSNNQCLFAVHILFFIALLLIKFAAIVLTFISLEVFKKRALPVGLMLAALIGYGFEFKQLINVRRQRFPSKHSESEQNQNESSLI